MSLAFATSNVSIWQRFPAGTYSLTFPSVCFAMVDVVRSAVVTGATKGIGKGLALGLAEGKWHVIATGRTATGPGSLEELSKEINEKGGSCETYTVDHSEDDQVQEFFENLVKSLNSNNRTLDVFVNNAFSGVSFLSETASVPLWEKKVSEDEEHPGAVWDIINDVGLRNNYVCSIYATRIMQRQKNGGVLVNTTSFGGLASIFDLVYSVGKEAINRLTAELALRTPPHIKAFALCPGFAGTESVDLVINMIKSENNVEHKDEYTAIMKENVETPLFIGRVLTAAVSDSKFLERVDGKVVICAEAADYFDVFDENGNRPLSFRSLKFLIGSAMPKYRNSILVRNIPRSALIPWIVMDRVKAVKFW